MVDSVLGDNRLLDWQVLLLRKIISDDRKKENL